MPGHLPAPRPSALTDEELWDEWRRSAASLSRPASTAETLAVVERRQQYLDEIEKRDPSVFVPRVTGGIALDWDDVIRLLDS
jgi:hypothetical protein